MLFCSHEYRQQKITALCIRWSTTIEKGILFAVLHKYFSDIRRVFVSQKGWRVVYYSSVYTIYTTLDGITIKPNESQTLYCRTANTDTQSTNNHYHNYLKGISEISHCLQ